MSFKVSNANKNIYYYTILMDPERVTEDDDSKIIIRTKKPKPKIHKRFEQIVYDSKRGEWTSITTSYS